MARLRAKYKVGDYVVFWFAGGIEYGTVLEMVKETKEVKYSIKDKAGYRYPVSQDKVIKKI